MFQPFIVSLVDHFLLSDRSVVDDDVQIAVNVYRRLNYSLYIVQIFVVRHDTGDFISLISDLLYRGIQFFLASGCHYDLCPLFGEQLCHTVSHAVACT